MNWELKQLLAVVPCAFALHSSMAQCPGCMPDPGCIISPPFPSLCPLAPPDATAGTYYETDITFWLPANFTDPGTGLDVSFEQMTITNVSGLPFGLSLQANTPNGTYHPQENEFGCARICGTPLGAGTFDVSISIVATVEFSGITIDAPQQFVITLIVLPGAGGNNSFTFSPAGACPGSPVEFLALIDASPQPTSWVWDFGNGGTSNAAQPPAQTYPGPGSYTVSLQTTISGYFLQSVNINGSNNNWCGDVEEPFCNCGTPIIGTCPDLYFVLNSGNGPIYSSGTINDVTSASWGGLDIPLDSPPYTITFHDEDVISSDDDLGTFAIDLSAGTDPVFNVAGGTAGSLTIALQVVQVFEDAEVVTIFEQPVVTIDEAGDQLCADDDLLSNYAWLLNGNPVGLPSSACITPGVPGFWSVVGTNGFGCSDTSNTILVCPVIDIVRSGNVLSVPEGFATYAWSFNGDPMAGSGHTMTTQGDGLYSVLVTDTNGCMVTAEYLLSTVGMMDRDASDSFLTVHPNPGHGDLTVVAAGLTHAQVRLMVLDMAGRMVHDENAATSDGNIRLALLLDIAPGSYVLRLVDGGRIRSSPLIVH